MATVGAGTRWNLPNYLGELYLIGAQASETPFLTMMGGLAGNRVQQSSSFEFATAQPWSLAAAAQPGITETASLTAPTPVSFVRGEDTNTVQIFQESVSLSYSKISDTGTLSGLNIDGTNPVQNETEWQIAANLLQIAKDVNFTFLNGVYQKATDAGTASKTRGILTATTTSAVAGGAAALSTDMIDDLIVTMATNGAKFANPVIFTSAYDVKNLSNLYAFAPQDRFIGGVAVSTLYHALVPRPISVVWDQNVPAGSLLMSDMSVCKPVALPVPGKGNLFFEELSKTGASDKGQIYGQLGIDYGAEEFHGKITGLATS